MGEFLPFPHDRQHTKIPTVPWITDGTSDWYWPAAEEHDSPTMLLVTDAKQKVAKIAQRHPKLRLTVDHMGIRSNNAGATILPYVEATVALARYPNVNVKPPNLPSFSAEAFPFADMRPVVQRVVRAFGPQRCLWGTDIPRMMAKYKTSYAQAIDMVMTHFDLLSAEDKEWIMGRAIGDWLRWPA